MELIESLQEAFSTPGQVLLHGSFVLLIVSMSMRNISMLRVFAVASGITALFYRIFIFYDIVSILWQSLLVAVNVLQLAILWAERFRPKLSSDAEFFIERTLSSVHRSSARRLIAIAQIREAGSETRLISEGCAVNDLMFMLEGQARVERSGQVIAQCGRGDFFGEMSYITGEAASADVIAEGRVRYMCFERAELRRVLRSDDELRNALEASFNRDLVAKLMSSNNAPRQAVAGVAG